MINLSTPMLSGRTSEHRKNQQSEEFFRLLGLVHSDSDDLDLAERQRRGCAKQRLSDLIETNENAPTSSSAIRPHRWIVDVLFDLATYARNEDLRLVCEYIEYAKANVLENLNARALGESSIKQMLRLNAPRAAEPSNTCFER